MLNGSKGIKEMLVHVGLNQVEFASMLGISKAALTQRLKQGYYNNPEKLSEACSVLGYDMELKIDCKLHNPSDGSQIIVTANQTPDKGADRES